MIKKKGILQSMVIKEPLKIDYETATVDEVVEMIEFAIEQHPSLLKVIPETFSNSGTQTSSVTPGYTVLS